MRPSQAILSFQQLDGFVPAFSSSWGTASTTDSQRYFRIDCLIVDTEICFRFQSATCSRESNSSPFSSLLPLFALGPGRVTVGRQRCTLQVCTIARQVGWSRGVSSASSCAAFKGGRRVIEEASTTRYFVGWRTRAEGRTASGPKCDNFGV